MTLYLFKTHRNPENVTDNIFTVLQWNMSDILVICKNWVRINGCFWMGINQHGISHANQPKPWPLYPSKQGSFIIISEFPGVRLMKRGVQVCSPPARWEKIVQRWAWVWGNNAAITPQRAATEVRGQNRWWEATDRWYEWGINVFEKTLLKPLIWSRARWKKAQKNWLFFLFGNNWVRRRHINTVAPKSIWLEW